MPFITDKQTIADLNLLGKYKAGSLFNLFNRVQTRGGERLMEEWFVKPLTNASAINERSARIQYLQVHNIPFDISREAIEKAAHYLTEARPSGLFAALLHCSSDKVRQLVYRSEKYSIQQEHIQAVQFVLRSARQLLAVLTATGSLGSPISFLQNKLASILNAPGLLHFNPTYPYSITQMAQAQFLLLNKCRKDLDDLLLLLYEFDVLIAVAQVARDKGLVFATAYENDKQEMLQVQELKHPCLLHAVGNDLRLARQDNMLFLTGANMAGKSTWMKTLGVSFYLAHMGFPVAAKSLHFNVMEGLFTSINVPDDLSQGWSHFYAEVMRVKQVAKEVSSGKRLFVLFDELFKGTNVKDAYDATLAVTERLARYQACSFVISTHIIEVADALAETPNIQFQFMPTVMKANVPTYTYRLTPGVTTDRQGMIIIDNEKILDMLA